MVALLVIKLEGVYSHPPPLTADCVALNSVGGDFYCCDSRKTGRGLLRTAINENAGVFIKAHLSSGNLTF